MAPISDNNSNGDEGEGGGGSGDMDTDTGQSIHYEERKKPVLMEDPVKDQEVLSMIQRSSSSPPLVFPPKKISPPPYSVRYPATSAINVSDYPSYPSPVPPPQYPMGYPSLYPPPGGSDTSSSGVDFTTNDSFTHTFLRGILTSIDSKDPVVAHAWLETLLDAIDLLPPEAIKREIVVIAIAKGQLSQSVASRRSSSRLLGKIATKLDQLTVQQEVLPTTLALCQDPEPEVRLCMCRHVGFVARGVGLGITKAAILPQLVELSNDEKSQVRLAAIETVVHLLSLLDDETCTQIIVPLVIKNCEQAKQLEDESLPNIAHFLGRLCHGLTPNLTGEQRTWFIEFYTHLSRLGVQSSTDESGKPMPDLVPITNKTLMFNACRRECAFNFPAMVLFFGPQNFASLLFPIFSGLAVDASPPVRKTLASSLHEVAKLVGNAFSLAKKQISNLFSDNNVDVLEAMIMNLVHVIDALARFGVLQFGQSGQYSDELSAALLKCERVVSQTRNWRLHADCLEKFSCLANCISSVTIQNKFIPMLFERMLKARPLPCRTAAARTLLVILRFTIKLEDRTYIMFRITEELSHNKNCHTRMLFLRLCEMSIALFSRNYFKQHFFRDLLCLSQDPVPNLRLKLCALLPKLKSLLYLPSDRSLLHHLEDTVKELLLHEQDRDVLGALQTAIDELDRTEMGVDGVPSMDADLDRENERKLREERLIYSMEEQMNKIHSVEPSPNHKRSSFRIGTEHYGSPSASPTNFRWAGGDLSDSRRRSESLPPSLSRGVGTTPTTGRRAEALRLESPNSSFIVSHDEKRPKPRFSSPEPSSTYSPDVSHSFQDSLPTTTSSASSWEQASDHLSSRLGSTTTPSMLSKESTSSSPASSSQANKSGALAPYSMSLENLDASAKEFLVDAGVTLEATNLLSTASSLPNLTKLEQAGRLHEEAPTKSNSSESILPLGGELSKLLISNEEMMRYEAEYKKASMEIASQDAAVKAVVTAAVRSSVAIAQMPSSSIPTTAASTSISSKISSGLPTRQSRPESRLRSPSSIPSSTLKSHLILSRDVPDTSSLLSSPSKIRPPGLGPSSSVRSSLQTPNSSSALPKFAFTGKFSSSTDKLQDSFERLAEKWEAKRKNLVNSASTSSAVALVNGPASASTEESQSSPLFSDNQARRASLMEHKLQAIKQHNIPKRTSLIKAPAQKRLSLSDQMGLVGRQAMERFILPKRKSVNVEASASYLDDGYERNGFGTSGESEDDETISNKSNKSSDEDLPPYPKSGSSPGSSGSSVLPLPPPPSTGIFDDAMSTYVLPIESSSTSRSQSSSHLVVKPLSSTIPSRFPSKMSFASSSLRHGSQVARSRRDGSLNSSSETSMMIVSAAPSARLLPPSTSVNNNNHQKQQLSPASYRGSTEPSSMDNYSNNQREQQLPVPPSNNPPLLHMHSAPSINLRSHNSLSKRGGGKQFEQENITPNHQQLQEPVSSSSLPSRGRGSFVPKFTRLPPPRYRPQPPASRRPQSQQEHYQGRGSLTGNPVAKQHPQGKSLSAENILDSSHYPSNLGNYHPPQSRGEGGGRQHLRSNLSPANVLYVNNIKRLSQHSSNSDGSSRSSSPQSTLPLGDELPASSDLLESYPPGSTAQSLDPERPQSNTSNLSSVIPQRSSSGIRMWQSNGSRGDPRAISTSEASSSRLIQSPSRSPSPRGEQYHVPEPAPSSPVSTTNGGIQSRLRRPIATSLSQLPPPSTALNSPRRLAQRNSYGGGPMSAQSSPMKISSYANNASRRPITSTSAGNSRANSPPDQRRKSSHYPNGTPTLKYGNTSSSASNLPRYPHFQNQSQAGGSQLPTRGRPTYPSSTPSSSRIPPPSTTQPKSASNAFAKSRILPRGTRSALPVPGFSSRT